MTTKIVALVDALGNLADFVLLPGQAHDMKGVEPLIDGVAFDALLADKAFDADWLLTELDARGASAIIRDGTERATRLNAWRAPVASGFCGSASRRVWILGDSMGFPTRAREGQ